MMFSSQSHNSGSYVHMKFIITRGLSISTYFGQIQAQRIDPSLMRRVRVFAVCGPLVFSMCMRFQSHSASHPRKEVGFLCVFYINLMSNRRK